MWFTLIESDKIRFWPGSIIIVTHMVLCWGAIIGSDTGKFSQSPSETERLDSEKNLTCAMPNVG